MTTKLNGEREGEELKNEREGEELWDASDEVRDSEAVEDPTNQQLPTKPIEANTSTGGDGGPVTSQQDTPERHLRESDGIVASDGTEANPRLNRLMVTQLAGSVPGWATKLDFVDGAVELYRQFEPADATESVLALLAVGLTNASMDGLDRANRAGLNPEVRQMELKLVHKASAAVVDVLKTLQSHRKAGDQLINVGNVNVGSGGQAIVGNVQAGVRKAEGEEK